MSVSGLPQNFQREFAAAVHCIDVQPVPVLDSSARQRAIDAALTQMEKQFGKGSVLRLGSRNTLPVSTISSGSISLDNPLGVGGVPRCRVVAIFGLEHSGKPAR